jgi:hypothetical protein
VNGADSRRIYTHNCGAKPLLHVLRTKTFPALSPERENTFETSPRDVDCADKMMLSGPVSRLLAGMACTGSIFCRVIRDVHDRPVTKLHIAQTGDWYPRFIDCIVSYHLLDLAAGCRALFLHSSTTNLRRPNSSLLYPTKQCHLRILAQYK